MVYRNVEFCFIVSGSEKSYTLTELSELLSRSFVAMHDIYSPMNVECRTSETSVTRIFI